MEYREDARVAMSFSNKVLPSVRQISLALLKDHTEPAKVYMKLQPRQMDFMGLFKDIYKFWFGRITNIERVVLWYPEVPAQAYRLHAAYDAGGRSIAIGLAILPRDYRRALYPAVNSRDYRALLAMIVSICTGC